MPLDNVDSYRLDIIEFFLIFTMMFIPTLSIIENIYLNNPHWEHFYTIKLSKQITISTFIALFISLYCILR